MSKNEIGKDRKKMSRGILTIDDIASKNTPAIVDYLTEKGIPALMFAWGSQVEQHYDEAVYALQKGIVVGNHSYSHPAFSTLSVEEGIEEIERCEEILDKLYKDAGVERKYRPFRFPYGDKGGKNKEAFQAYFKEKKFHKVNDKKLTYPWWKENHLDTDMDTLWSFDFEEYRIRPNSDFTKEDVWAKMHDQNPAQGGVLFAPENSHILLLHAHDETEAMVPGYYALFLDHLLENGFHFEEPEFL